MFFSLLGFHIKSSNTFFVRRKESKSRHKTLITTAVLSNFCFLHVATCTVANTNSHHKVPASRKAHGKCVTFAGYCPLEVFSWSTLFPCVWERGKLRHIFLVCVCVCPFSLWVVHFTKGAMWKTQTTAIVLLHPHPFVYFLSHFYGVHPVCVCVSGTYFKT